MAFDPTPFVINNGLASDDTIFDAEGQWYDCSLIRWWRGKPQTMGGWQKINTGSMISGICRGMLSWTDTAAVLNLGLGTHTNLYVLVGGGLFDITPSGLAAGNADGISGSGFGAGAFGSGTFGGSSAAEYWPRTWSLDAFGQILLANPRNGTIYQWSNDPTVIAAPLSNAPEAVTCISVAQTRQVLAFGCTKVDGTFGPMTIRGSDGDNMTSWDISLDSIAFEVTLAGGGRIVAARPVGEYYFVWSDNAVYQGTYIGSSTQSWKFEKVSEHCGLIGAQAVCIRNQTAFWIGPDLQVRSLTLGGAVQIVSSPTTKTFADNLAANQADKIVASTSSPFDEVWFFYPDSRDGTENSRYFGFCANDTSIPWFRGQLVRTCFIDQGPAPYPIGVDTTGYAYYHELGQSADGANLPWFIESAGQYIGDAKQWLLIGGIWPDVSDQVGSISLTIYLRDYPQSTERVRGPYVLMANQSKKDFLAQGRIARLRFSGTSAPAFARLGKPSFLTQATGQQ